jgi:hypothetical protein
MVSAVTLNVMGSMSQNTGLSPAFQTAPAVAKKVKAGRITSSPGSSSSAFSGRRRASVPLAQPTAWRQPTRSAISVSSRSTAGPRMKRWERTTSMSAASSSSLMVRYWAVKSRSGTLMRLNP